MVYVGAHSYKSIWEEGREPRPRNLHVRPCQLVPSEVDTNFATCNFRVNKDCQLRNNTKLKPFPAGQEERQPVLCRYAIMFCQTHLCSNYALLSTFSRERICFKFGAKNTTSLMCCFFSRGHGDKLWGQFFVNQQVLF